MLYSPPSPVSAHGEQACMGESILVPEHDSRAGASSTDEHRR